MKTAVALNRCSFLKTSLAAGTAFAGVACILLTVRLRAESVSADSLRLVPFPKQVQVANDGLKLEDDLVIQVNEIEPATQAAVDLQLEMARRAKGEFAVRTMTEKNGEPLLLWLGAKKTPRDQVLRVIGSTPEQEEGYELVVNNKFAAVGARHPAGLAHGIQTLRQLVRANVRDGRIPAVTIRDWPSLRYRGFSDDITRGPSPTVATLQGDLDLTAFLRMNFFTYYLEHQFAFAKHPLIGPKDGSLKPEELKALVAYAADRGVEIIGNQQSFGHFWNLLRHEPADLRETPNIVNPVNEKTYQFLDDLYSEQAPLLTSKFFNVCCDETEGLGTGASKELAAQIGVGGVYTRHIRRLHDLLRDHYGKRMMMWGDIILNHPDNLADIPKDTVMLTWGYDARASFEKQITPFAKSGYEFFICPGVSCWNRVLPDFQVAVTNISHFVRDGAKQNALGMLNTTWDDSGENLAGYNWHGIAWGAECAWNASATPIEVFNRRVGAVLFGNDGPEFGEAVELLGRAHRLSTFEKMNDKAFWKVDFAELLKNEKSATSQAETLKEIVRTARTKLVGAKQSARVDAKILDQFIFGADRMEFMADRILEGGRAVSAYRQAAVTSDAAEASRLLRDDCIARISGLRDKLASLKPRYIELWNRENRPFALDVVTRRFDVAIGYYDGVLKRLAAAEENLKNRRPLPPVEQIGFPATHPGS
jgi:hexosaminidase